MATILISRRKRRHAHEEVAVLAVVFIVEVAAWRGKGDVDRVCLDEAHRRASAVLLLGPGYDWMLMPHGINCIDPREGGGLIASGGWVAVIAVGVVLVTDDAAIISGRLAL